MEGLQHRGCAC